MNTALSFIVMIAAAVALLVTIPLTVVLGKQRSQLALQLLITFGAAYGFGAVANVGTDSITAAVVNYFAIGLILYMATEYVMLLIGRSRSNRLQAFLGEVSSLWLVAASLYTISNFEPMTHDKLFVVVIAGSAAHLAAVYWILYRHQSSIKSLLGIATKPSNSKPKPSKNDLDTSTGFSSRRGDPSLSVSFE